MPLNNSQTSEFLLNDLQQLAFKSITENVVDLLTRFIVEKPYYFSNGNRFFDNELFKTSCDVTESYVSPSLAIRFFEKKKMKIIKNYHRKHKKYWFLRAFTFAKQRFAMCQNGDNWNLRG